MSHKYHAKQVVTEDGRFHSMAEHRHWCELRLLEKAGAIKHLQRQVVFPLNAVGGGFVGNYVADMVYEEDGKRVVVDVKGFDTPLSKWKRKHAQKQYDMIIKLIQARGRNAR